MAEYQHNWTTLANGVKMKKVGGWGLPWGSPAGFRNLHFFPPELLHHLVPFLYLLGCAIIASLCLASCNECHHDLVQIVIRIPAYIWISVFARRVQLCRLVEMINNSYKFLMKLNVDHKLIKYMLNLNNQRKVSK